MGRTEDEARGLRASGDGVHAAPPAASAAMALPIGQGPPGRRIDRRDRLLKPLLTIVQLGPVLILGVLVVTMSLASGAFLSSDNLTNLGFQTAITAALAIGQLLVVLTRGIDLSVGSVVALTGVLGALVGGTSWGHGAVPVIAVMLATGAAVGTLNGFLFVVGRVPHPFIVTLATLGVVQGLALIASGGAVRTTIPQAVISIGSGTAGGVPIAVLVVVAVAILGQLFLVRTQWGRWTYALGGDPEAARRLGIPTRKVLFSVYVLCGLMAAVAGMIVTGRTAAGDPNAGALLELDAITAVFVGGASFFGGRGSIPNALVGAVILGVIRNGMDLIGVSPFYQEVTIGMAILASVELDVARGYIEERLRVHRVA